MRRKAARIVIKPGVYEESLTVDKPIEIEGEGQIGEIRLCARGMHVICFRAKGKSRISNVSIRQKGAGFLQRKVFGDLWSGIFVELMVM